MKRAKRKVTTIKIKIKKGEARLNVYKTENNKIQITAKFHGSIPKNVKSALKKIAKKY